MHRVAESHPVRTSISLHYHIAGIATEMCRSTDLSLLYLTYLWQWEYAVDSSFGSTRPLGHHFAGKNGPVIPFHGLFGHGRKSMNRLIRQACCASRPGCSPVSEVSSHLSSDFAATFSSAGFRATAVSWLLPGVKCWSHHWDALNLPQ